MNVGKLAALTPQPLLRHLKHFEAEIEDALKNFAGSLPEAARVFDGGAGEGQYKHIFSRQRYIGVDLGVGDASWNYTAIDVLGDLALLPFVEGAFDAAISIVTLEHVREPGRALCEMRRVLRPGARLLLVAPLDWEEHQEPVAAQTIGELATAMQAGDTASLRSPPKMPLATLAVLAL